MKRFIVMAEGCRWSETAATSAEMAYRGQSFLMPSTRCAILDPETGKVEIYTRRLDRHGNLICIQREV